MFPRGEVFPSEVTAAVVIVATVSFLPFHARRIRSALTWPFFSCGGAYASLLGGAQLSLVSMITRPPPSIVWYCDRSAQNDVQRASFLDERTAHQTAWRKYTAALALAERLLLLSQRTGGLSRAIAGLRWRPYCSLDCEQRLIRSGARTCDGILFRLSWQNWPSDMGLRNNCFRDLLARG
jgi:hypothetical protein